jgi:hypothetical protein
VSRQACHSTPRPSTKHCGGLYEGDLRIEVSDKRAQDRYNTCLQAPPHVRQKPR